MATADAERGIRILWCVPIWALDFREFGPSSSPGSQLICWGFLSEQESRLVLLLCATFANGNRWLQLALDATAALDESENQNVTQRGEDHPGLEAIVTTSLWRVFKRNMASQIRKILPSSAKIMCIFLVCH